MGLFDFLKKNKEEPKEEKKEEEKAKMNPNKNEYTFTFKKLPDSVEELMSLPEASLDSPYKTAALAVLALCVYKKDKELCMDMLNALRGPDPLSNYDRQFLKERLTGKEYKPYSFFKGATPQNAYTPTMPYTITVKSNSYSFQEDNYAVLLIHSGGADTDRQFKLRKKPSTGQWFSMDIVALADIRIPTEQDPWA